MSGYNKTLQELWEEAGRKPFMAEENDGQLFEVVDIRGKSAIGYSSIDEGCTRCPTVRYWKLHKPAPKMVKWYSPKVTWWEGDNSPDLYSTQFRRSKDLTNWYIRPESIKVLEWEEREFPETWEECE